MSIIKPSELIKIKREAVPVKLIKAFNDLIIEKWGENCAVFTKGFVIQKYNEMNGGANPDEKWFKNIELIFEHEGWEVKVQDLGSNGITQIYYTFYIKK